MTGSPLVAVQRSIKFREYGTLKLDEDELTWGGHVPDIVDLRLIVRVATVGVAAVGVATVAAALVELAAVART